MKYFVIYKSQNQIIATLQIEDFPSLKLLNSFIDANKKIDIVHVIKGEDLEFNLKVIEKPKPKGKNESNCKKIEAIPE